MLAIDHLWMLRLPSSGVGSRDDPRAVGSGVWLFLMSVIMASIILVWFRTAVAWLSIMTFWLSIMTFIICCISVTASIDGGGTIVRWLWLELGELVAAS